MVITSGGVSVGPRDYTPQIVDSLGKPGIVVYGISVKPGKPTTVGFVGEKPVFSLPGNPTSALLIYYLLARPLVLQLAGRPVTGMKTVGLLLEQECSAPRAGERLLWFGWSLTRKAG